MKGAAVFITVLAVSALSLAEDRRRPQPFASMTPARMFEQSTTVPPTTNATTATTHTTTATPNTTTATTHTTTATANTTTATANTTTATANTTTAAANTTTAAANTTTAAINTTTAAANTTTATTSTITTQPSPEPTPPTNATVGNYTLMKDKKVICLMAQVALKIRVAAPKANGTFIVQPKMTKVQGGCLETSANLTLTFKEGHITFMFNKSDADNIVYVDALSFSLSYSFNTGGNAEYTANNKSLHLFPAKVGHSYSCKSQSLYMGDGLYLDVSQDQMQAFNLTKSNEFGTPDVCPADKPDYRVAIAVGVTLLVLIVVVVVVYLLGRRKRTNGYQSL